MRVSVIFILVLALCAKAQAAVPLAENPPLQPATTMAVSNRCVDVHPDGAILLDDFANLSEFAASDVMDADAGEGGDSQAIPFISPLFSPSGRRAASSTPSLWPSSIGLRGLRICRNNR